MASRTPAEIFDKVFSYVECFSPRYIDAHWDHAFSLEGPPGEFHHGSQDDKILTLLDVRFYPYSSLVPLLTVCKLWHDVSERRLYNSISIRDTGYSDLKLQRLLTTVSNSAHLASLVREVRFGVLACDSETHGKILAHCIGLVRLELVVEHEYTDVQALGRAVDHFRHLRFLHFVRRPSRSRSSSLSRFCSADDMMRWWKKCPRLEYITVFDDEVEGQDGEAVDGSDLDPEASVDATKDQDSCSSLSLVEFFPSLPMISTPLRRYHSTKSLTAVNLQYLASATLHMTSFYSFVDLSTKRCAQALADALSGWALTLQHLSLFTRSPTLEGTAPIGSICQQLAGLKTLGTTTKLIPPELLRQFTNLTRLFYIVDTPNDVSGLADAIPQMKALKSLILVHQELSPMVFDLRSEAFAEAMTELSRSCALNTVRLIQMDLNDSYASFTGNRNSWNGGHHEFEGYYDNDYDDSGSNCDDDSDDDPYDRRFADDDNDRFFEIMHNS